MAEEALGSSRAAKKNMMMSGDDERFQALDERLTMSGFRLSAKQDMSTTEVTAHGAFSMHEPPSEAVRIISGTSKISEDEDEEEHTLRARGYKIDRFIMSTLQGKRFTAQRICGGMDSVVIKATLKHLHRQGITVSDDGKVFAIKENIVKEAAIMRRFAGHNPPKSLIRFVDFFEDARSYFLVLTQKRDSVHM